MPAHYELAAILAALLAVLHSVAGEMRILLPLDQCRDVPKILGSIEHTKRAIRIIWHIVSIFLMAMATVIWLMGDGKGPATMADLSRVLSVSFFASGVLTLIVSRAQHGAWPVLFILAALTF